VLTSNSAALNCRQDSVPECLHLGVSGNELLERSVRRRNDGLESVFLGVRHGSDADTVQPALTILTAHQPTHTSVTNTHT